MRFLALETDVNVFKKRFLVQDEEELLTARRHVLLFAVTLLFVSLISIVVIYAGIMLMTNGDALQLGVLLILLWIIIALCWTTKSYIDWKYDFLIVTTEKILLINHLAFLSQHVETIRMELITQPRSASQFLGIGRCGTLHLQVRSMENIPARHIAISYLPAPDVIAGTIEKAIVLLQQRPADKGVQGQQEKIEEARQNVRDEVQS